MKVALTREFSRDERELIGWYLNIDPHQRPAADRQDCRRFMSTAIDTMLVSARRALDHGMRDAADKMDELLGNGDADS